MRAKLIYEHGEPRLIPSPTGYLLDCRIETPPSDADRNVWIELTKLEAIDLQHRLGFLLWQDAQ